MKFQTLNGKKIIIPLDGYYPCLLVLRHWGHDPPEQSGQRRKLECPPTNKLTSTPSTCTLILNYIRRVSRTDNEDGRFRWAIRVAALGPTMVVPTPMVCNGAEIHLNLPQTCWTWRAFDDADNVTSLFPTLRIFESQVCEVTESYNYSKEGTIRISGHLRRPQLQSHR